MDTFTDKARGFTIRIDYSRDNLLPDFAKLTLKDRYFDKGETSPQESFARASCAFANDKEHAQRLYDYVSKLWFSYSTPILSNGGTSKGLPISCFTSYVDDSVRGLSSHFTENIFSSVRGGGLGAYWGDVRSIGEGTKTGNTTTGVVSWMHNVDAQMLSAKQGSTRRGSYAAYLDVSHPEIEAFIEMRKPSGGDINRKNLNLHHSVNLPDDFMMAVKTDGNWDLIDPNSKKVTKTLKARELWYKILLTRAETGEPFLHFIDTTNNALPQPLKDKGLYVHNSNLCCEITLPTNKDRTGVCCLSSVNLEMYSDWAEDSRFIPDLVMMLDNVLDYFIANAEPEMHRSIESARNERSIGLGAMGFHAFLQKNGVAFESVMAKVWNDKIFSHIKECATDTSIALAKSRGIAPDMEGFIDPETGLGSPRRFSHLTAIAPNASSSIICGNTSPSIEPYAANAYTQKTLSGSSLVKNKFLERRLKELGMNTSDIWHSIIVNDGSVQHLNILSEEDKNLFKTSKEIDQKYVINLAADRQRYIGQAQSINLFFKRTDGKQEFSDIHFSAWKKGIKSLYYCRTEAATKTETITKLNKLGNEVGAEKALETKDQPTEDDCLYCE